jgi:CheY-like chemotaxis protein
MTRVLLVDDEAMVRHTLRTGLESRSYDVIEAGSGQAALALLRESAVDVAVLDVNMPGMSGIETAAAIRSERPNVKVLLLSGSTQSTAEDVAAMAPSLGADAVLLKPLRIRELCAAIERALAGEADPP